MGANRSKAAVAVAVMLLGVVAEAVGGAWPTPITIADLAAGVVLTGSGWFGWSRHPESRVGPLVLLAGCAWFLGTLAGSEMPAVAAVGAALLMIHRAPIVHAIVAYPSGRTFGPGAVAVVVGAYLYSAVVPVARNDVATAALTAALIAATFRQYQRSTGRARQARRTAVTAAGILAVSLLIGSIGRLVGAGSGLEGAAVWVYTLGVGLAALLLVVDLSRARWTQGEVERLIVDLGDEPSAGIRGRLGDALGDPSLEVAYWVPETGGYLDERGQPITLPAIGSGRAVTPLEHP
jgi:hypothetical protein